MEMAMRIPHRLYTPLLLLPVAFGLWGQTFTPIPITNQTFYSYSSVSKPIPPTGAQSLLLFPNQTNGGQRLETECSTYANLQYAHYDWNGSGWTGPRTGPVYAYFTEFYSQNTPTSMWQGVSGNVSFEGVIGSNNSPTTQNFIQAFYFATDRCYEHGPEVGFYKLFIHAGDPTEESTVYFYYGNNVNCYNYQGSGSCRDKNTGAALQYNATAIPLPSPPAFNSQGGKNYVYSAYLTAPNTFRVTIKDPYTNADAISPQSIVVESYFNSIASEMYVNGLSGYIAVTQQRNSVQGGITDSMTNPLKLTVYALMQIALASPVYPQPSPDPLSYGAAQGNCEQGNGTVTVSGITSSSSTLVMRSYPSCTVTVFLAGTNTAATIFSDSTGTPKTNPFTSSNMGRWNFYAPNGSYDVRLSGGGLSSPFTVGGVSTFASGGYRPSKFFIFPSGGVPGTFGILNGGGSYYAGFTAGAVGANQVWRLPLTDAAGCWQSDGSFNLFIATCPGGGGGGGGTPGGITGSLQFNNAGVFAGDANLTWTATPQLLTITGKGGTSALTVNTGYILANAGIVTNAGSWQGVNTNVDGALLRGVHIAANTSNTLGGYINIAPLPYGTEPLPLPGLANFGLHSGLIWVGGNNTATPDVTYGINTNLYINAAGGFATFNTPYNTFQAPNGGMFAKSFTALNYLQMGSSNGPPTPTQFDTINAGALYWDTVLSSARVFNGTTWTDLGGGGGGGSPGGANTNLQFNSSGAFGGSSNLIWINASQILRVTGVNSASAAIAVDTGFIQSEKGFVDTAGTAYNSFQSPAGGMAARSFTAQKYIQVGTSAGAPTVTTSDTFNPGALYWDTGSNGLQVWDGANWIGVGGGAGTPGGANTNVQYNASGAFGGSANFTFDSAAQLLHVEALNSTSAGISVGTGFVQSATGFLAVAGTATQYNAIQAPGGGVAARSLTSLRYTQLGFFNTTPTVTAGDTFNAGAVYFDTVNACLELFNGVTWNCITGGGGGGTPGGVNTSIQFNNSGAFGGGTDLTWNNSTKLLSVNGTAATAAIDVTNNAFIQTSGGLVVTGTNQYNSIQTTANGGMAARSFTASKYIQVGFNAGAPTVTTSDTFNPGALSWDTNAAALRVYNGSSWVSLATTLSGVSSLNTLVGAVSIAGTTDQISVTPAANILVLSTPQAIGTSSNVTFGNVTSAGVLQSQATGASTAFQTTNFNFQVDGNGNISGAGQVNLTGGSSAYKLAGTTVISTARNGFFNNLSVNNTTTNYRMTVTGPSAAANGAAIAAFTTGTGQSTDESLTFGVLDGQYSWIQAIKPGSAYRTLLLNPSAGEVVVGGNAGTGAKLTVNGGVFAAGAFNASVTGASIAFQTANSNFQVDGNGNVSGAGQFNATGASSAYKMGGTTFVDQNRNGFFVNATVTNLTVNGTCTGCASGVTSLNSISGAVSIAATANQTTVSNFGSIITIGTVQGIGTASSPQFANLTISGQGTFNGQLTLNNAGTALFVNGGNATIASDGRVTGTSFAVGGNFVINSGRQFVGTGVDVGTGGISAGGYNINGGFLGQTYTVTITGGISGVPGCGSGLIFRGGVLVSCF